MEKRFRLVIVTLALIATIFSGGIAAFADDPGSLAENTAALCIVDSVTGNIVQDTETVNVIINRIETGENGGRYYLQPATGETVNTVSNNALLVVENSVTGDIVQNVINNTYIINNILAGDQAYRLRPLKTKTKMATHNRNGAAKTEYVRRRQAGGNRSGARHEGYTHLQSGHAAM